MPKTFLVSDESINSYKCRVLSEGGDITAFESNPIMLYMHLRGNVIGKWENVRLENGAWYADPIFDMEDTKPGGGADIGGKVEREFLKAASIGIEILEGHYNDLLDCYDVTKWSLMEISIVDIGSNQNAFRLYKDGEPLTELQLSAQLEQFKPTINPTISTPQIMELKAIALAMGLAETATEQDVLTMAAQRKNLNDVSAELAQLKLQMQNDQTTEATQIVEQAVSDGRIAANLKDGYLKLFAADHASTKAIVAALPKPANLVQFATNGQATQAVVAGLSSADLVTKYDELDRAGTLLNLAKSDYPTFEKMYEAKYGQKPDKLKIA